MVWYSHLFQDFPQFIVIHTVKGFGHTEAIYIKHTLGVKDFGIVNKAEIDVYWMLAI